jgi:hypothetical protein
MRSPALRPNLHMLCHYGSLISMGIKYFLRQFPLFPIHLYYLYLSLFSMTIPLCLLHTNLKWQSALIEVVMALYKECTISSHFSLPKEAFMLWTKTEVFSFHGSTPQARQATKMRVRLTGIKLGLLQSRTRLVTSLDRKVSCMDRITKRI